MFEKIKIQEVLKSIGVEISLEKAEKLSFFSRKLLSTNKEMNLLAKGEEENFLERHLLDSLTALPLLVEEKGPWMDLGSGGGLPSLPLAVCCQQRPIFLVESREKKANFLTRIIGELALGEVFVIQERAEDLARDIKFREKINVVTARGLAPLPSLLELALPFIRVGGILLAWKGPALDEELEKSSTALELLGGIPEKQVSNKILGREHFLQIIRKEKNSPDRFPRRPTAIKKRPLG